MLYTIAVILLVLWLLGLVTSSTIGGFIHILLVIAIVMVLVNVIGGSDMTLREAEMIVEAVSAKISPNAHIIWGASVDEQLQKKSVRVLAVLAGLKEGMPMKKMASGEMRPEEPIDVEFI